jgi:transcriptional regulator with XRE-family HTH domain
MTTLGQRLEKAREDKELRQQDLAECAGVTRGAVSQWLSDGTSPSLPTLLKLSMLLDVDPAWLAFGIEVAEDRRVVYLTDAAHSVEMPIQEEVAKLAPEKVSIDARAKTDAGFIYNIHVHVHINGEKANVSHEVKTA